MRHKYKISFTKYQQLSESIIYMHEYE